jgi:hypothetical protein
VVESSSACLCSQRSQVKEKGQSRRDWLRIRLRSQAARMKVLSYCVTSLRLLRYFDRFNQAALLIQLYLYDEMCTQCARQTPGTLAFGSFTRQVVSLVACSEARARERCACILYPLHLSCTRTYLRACWRGPRSHAVAPTVFAW